MVENKLKCSYRHCNSAHIDTVRMSQRPLIVSKSTPKTPILGKTDGAHIDTPSRVCHRRRFFLSLISKQNLSRTGVKTRAARK
jgi:hypothetical protein